LGEDSRCSEHSRKLKGTQGTARPQAIKLQSGREEGLGVPRGQKKKGRGTDEGHVRHRLQETGNLVKDIVEEKKLVFQEGEYQKEMS